MGAPQKKPAATTPLLTIPFAIPAYWTPEQALAVFELLEDLRDAIADRYTTQLCDAARELHQPQATQPDQPGRDDDPLF